VFRLIEVRLELLIIGVYLFWVLNCLSHTHLAAPQLEVWSYNELNTPCLYADTKTKENAFFFKLLLDVIVSNFLIRNLFFYYLLTVRLLCCS